MERGRLIVFYNQQDITANLESDSDGVLNENLAMALANNTFTAVFSNSQITHAVFVSLIPEVGYLAYALNLDNSLSLTTAGLLGIRNGDPNDDFTYRDGSTIPSDASDQMIHEWGQSCMRCVYCIRCDLTGFHFYRANNWGGEPVLLQ